MKQSENKGKCFVVIGDTGTGKSHFVETTFCQGGFVIYDVQNEFQNIELDNKAETLQCRVSSFDVDFSEFILLCRKRINSNLIFEEATAFFSFRASREMMKQVISKRHGNNNYIFVFHSIKQVPKDLFELTNYVVLFPTKDLEKDVNDKRPELLPFWKDLRVKRGKNEYPKHLIKL